MPTSSSTQAARYCALAIALITAITLIIRVFLASQQYGSVLLGLSYLSQFFTILTNLLVLIVMTRIGLNLKWHQGVLESSVVAIVCVCVVYHALLAHLKSHHGLAMLANQGVHTVVPLLTLLWWLAFADMCAMSWKDTLKTTLWPLIYLIYVLIRAQWSNVYPYPFLNLTELGATKLSVNIAGLCFAFLTFSFILLAISRYRCRSTVAQST